MTRIKIRHGGILTCGAKGCDERFVSYSVLMVIRRQAELAGWGRVPEWQVTGDTADGTRKTDVCPTHKAIAASNKARKAELVAAEKTRRTLEKADAQAKKSAAHAVRIAETSRKKVAKAEAQAARDQKRATRAEQNARKAAQRSEKARAREAKKASMVEAKKAKANAKRDAAVDLGGGA